MIVKDFHGYIPSYARDETHRAVGSIRMSRTPDTIEFIVGNGNAVRGAVCGALRDEGVEHHEKWGNPGVIVATVE